MSDFWTVLLGGYFVALLAGAFGFVMGYIRGRTDRRGAIWEHGKPLFVIRSAEYQPPADQPLPTPKEARAFRARLLATTRSNTNEYTQDKALLDEIHATITRINDKADRFINGKNEAHNPE